MKLNKVFLAALIAGTVGVSSCKEDFLDETQITQHDTEYFKTQDGIEALVTGAYQTLKFRYEYQWAYKMWTWVSTSLQAVTTIWPTITTIVLP